MSRDGGASRINLRLPDHPETSTEQAAGRAGLSVNAWLVRAAAAGVLAMTAFALTWLSVERGLVAGGEGAVQPRHRELTCR